MRGERGQKTTHIAGRKMRRGFELYFDLGGIDIEKDAERLWCEIRRKLGMPSETQVLRLRLSR